MNGTLRRSRQPLRMIEPEPQMPGHHSQSVAGGLKFYQKRSMVMKLTLEDVTQEVKEAVRLYLEKHAIAEETRARVDVIQRQILAEEVKLYANPDGLRIFDPEETYLSDDEEAWQRYQELCDAKEREGGIKPPEMELDYCPALVAEREQLEAEWVIMDAAAVMLKLEFDGRKLNNLLLCEQNGKGLERRQKFIDTVVALVIAIESGE